MVVARDWGIDVGLRVRSRGGESEVERRGRHGCESEEKKKGRNRRCDGNRIESMKKTGGRGGSTIPMNRTALIPLVRTPMDPDGIGSRRRGFWRNSVDKLDKLKN